MRGQLAFILCAPFCFLMPFEVFHAIPCCSFALKHLNGIIWRQVATHSPLPPHVPSSTPLHNTGEKARQWSLFIIFNWYLKCALLAVGGATVAGVELRSSGLELGSLECSPSKGRAVREGDREEKYHFN